LRFLCSFPAADFGVSSTRLFFFFELLIGTSSFPDWRRFLGDSDDLRLSLSLFSADILKADLRR
jgi:hypothetical protein